VSQPGPGGHAARAARARRPALGPASSTDWSTVASPLIPAGMTGAAVLPGAVLVGSDAIGGPVSCQQPAGLTGGLLIAPLTDAGPGRTAPSVGPLPPSASLGLNIDAGPSAAGQEAAVLFSKPLSLDGNCDTSENLYLADLEGTGAMTRETALASDQVVGDEDVVGSTTGAVAAAWIVLAGQDPTTDVLHVAVEPADRPPPAAVTVARRVAPEELVDGIASLALAIDAAGDTLVAYATEREVYALTVDGSGAPGPAQAVGPCNERCAVAVGENPAGRAVVAWDSQSGPSEPASPLAILAAIRPSADAPFGTSR
jgi:hypothetical protein